MVIGVLGADNYVWCCAEFSLSVERGAVRLLRDSNTLMLLPAVCVLSAARVLPAMYACVACCTCVVHANGLYVPMYARVFFSRLVVRLPLWSKIKSSLKPS